jgi:NAD+ kinase
MKVRLIGKNLADIRPLLGRYGLQEAEDTEIPELIIAHGGDGSFLQSEQLYPGIAKLPIRDERTAPRCPDHTTESLLELFCSGRCKPVILPKAAASCNGKILTGINDVFLHNRDRVSALRYRVRIDGELYANEIVGDGVGLATVHGSTAYYRSITHSIFRVGIGLAFSNSTEEVSHLVLDAASRVSIEVVRGPGLLMADNAAETVEVKDGDSVEFFLSGETVPVYLLEEFMCSKCRVLRHPNKLPFKGYF